MSPPWTADSKDQSGPVLAFEPTAWRNFVGLTKQG
ncbi:DUF397 domain-containing protein [Micromonospora sp. NPDC049523]